MSSYETAWPPTRRWRDLIGQELEPPADHPAADRLGELHLAGGAGRLRLGAHQQVRRGLSRAGATTAGNQVIDEVEDLARDRAEALFGAEHANVQPHAGANANLAVYQALLEPGDTVLAMRLDHGGHLTHGSPACITSKIWRFVSYGVTPASRRRRRARARSSTSTRWPTWPSTEQPSADRGRLHRLRPDHRPPAVPGDRRLGGRPASCSTPPIRPGSSPAAPTRRPVGVADVVTFTTHKTLRGPRGGAIVCSAELAKAIDSAVFPGLQGGPLEHVIAAKAVAFAEAARPEFRDLRGPGRGQRRRPGRRAGGRGVPPRLGRHRQPPGPGATCAPSTPS